MAYKDPEKRRAYQRQYYQQKIQSDPVKMQERAVAQRKHARKTGYAATKQYNKKTYKAYTLHLRYNEDSDLIDLIEQQKNDGESTTDVFRKILRKLIETIDI